MIKIIVAVSSNMVIGKGNDLPWNLPTDMKHFKEITSGHSVLMGRKCWESIPEKYRPLPNRVNIILSRQEDYIAKGATVTNDLKHIFNKFKDSNEILFVIGGSEIYKEAFEVADAMFLTQITENIDGDVFLQGLDLKKWTLTEMDDMITENGFTYRIEHYVKKK